MFRKKNGAMMVKKLRRELTSENMVLGARKQLSDVGEVSQEMEWKEHMAQRCQRDNVEVGSNVSVISAKIGCSGCSVQLNIVQHQRIKV
jgi:hypothetical protein